MKDDQNLSRKVLSLRVKRSGLSCLSIVTSLYNGHWPHRDNVLPNVAWHIRNSEMVCCCVEGEIKWFLKKTFFFKLLDWGAFRGYMRSYTWALWFAHQSWMWQSECSFLKVITSYLALWGMQRPLSRTDLIFQDVEIPFLPPYLQVQQVMTTIWAVLRTCSAAGAVCLSFAVHIDEWIWIFHRVRSNAVIILLMWTEHR